MSEGFDILCRMVDGTQHYAYRYRFSFKPCLPRKIQDAQRFLKSYLRYEDIETLADKLKWLRHQKGMMQREVAEAIGMSRSGYIRLETGVTTMCAQETLDKLEGVFGVELGVFHKK